MPDKKIYILTGPVQSGKTTTLMQWAGKRKDVFGILTPVVDNKRVFLDVHSKEQFEMEAGKGEESVFAIGKFVFSKSSFKKAIDILKKAFKEKEGWVVIDEVGPLELKGEGFDSAIKNILTSDSKLNILFVVRDSIVDEVVKHYNIGSVIITKEDQLFLK